MNFGVADGTRTHFALVHSQRARLFALGHRMGSPLRQPGCWGWEFGRRGRSRTFVFRLSSERSTLEPHAEEDWSGQRELNPCLHNGKVSCYQATPWPREMFWLGRLDLNQDEELQRLLCYRYTTPQYGAGERNRTSKGHHGLRIYSPLSPPPAQRRRFEGNDRPGKQRVELNDHLRLAPACRPLHHVS
jgi:hypothetical protein